MARNERLSPDGVTEVLSDKPRQISVKSNNRMTDHERFMRIIHAEKYRKVMAEMDVFLEEDDDFQEDPDDNVTLYEELGYFSSFSRKLPSLEEQEAVPASPEPSGEGENVGEVIP